MGLSIKADGLLRLGTSAATRVWTFRPSGQPSYMAEKNWKEVYKSKEQMSVLIYGWEWEPEDDKTRKNLLRTQWRGTVLGSSMTNDTWLWAYPSRLMDS